MTSWQRIKLAWKILFGVPLVGEGETTSREVARIAGRGLSDPLGLTPKEIRIVCASALTQAPDRAARPL